MWILDTVLTIAAWSGWIAYFVLLSKGVFKKEQDMCAPVYDPNKPKENS